MRTNLLQKILPNVKTLLLAALVGVTVAGCGEEKDFSRSNTLLVFYDKATQAPAPDLVCGVFGGLDTLYVRSNVDYKTMFRTGDEEQKNWVQYQELGWNEQLQAKMVEITYTPSKEGTYAKRTGTLSFVYPSDYLGQFVTFSQGFDTRLSEKFEWLNTGSDSPLETTGEKLIADWTEAQKDKGWTSPFVGQNTKGYVYSKRGYLKIGDGVHAAQLRTPDMAKIISDSIVLVTFKAVAYVAQDGTQDGNKLTITVENGGKFKDGKKTKAIELPYYDPNDADLKNNMWKKTTIKTFLVTDKNEAFTANTRLVFSTPEGANRVFIDDINIYIIKKESLYVLDGIQDQL